MFSRLQYITDSPRLAEQACRAGVKWVQVRVKSTDEKTWVEIAHDIAKICKANNAICIVNDNPEIALQVNANGVHLGKKDMSLADAKKIIKTYKLIIGGSANTAEDVIWLAEQKVDYMGLGPLRFTSTKKDLNPVLGIEGYTKIMEEVRQLPIAIPPIYAIGGIVAGDIQGFLSMGIYGVAVSSAISNAKNINLVVQEFMTGIEGGLNAVLNEKELNHEIRR